MAPVALLATALAASTLVPPSNDDVRKLLAERVSALSGPDDGVGIVVGLIEPRGRRVVAYGQSGGPRALDGDTVFEIGSVGKVFAALVLAEMARKGEVRLTDPVAKYLPGVRVPERGGRAIRLVDLATHTSGLPFMPDDLPALDSDVAFGSAQLYAFLSRATLRHEIGDEWDYSNVGYWLMGEALAARAGTEYGTLLRRRVLRPLGLKSTALALSPGLAARLALGHDAVLGPVRPAAEIPMLRALPAAGGGLVSTANDMLALLAQTLGYERSPLEGALASLLETRRPSLAGSEQALGWTMTAGPAPLISHEGGTLGFASAVAWDPATRVGVVVLSNQLTGVGDIARHLLRPSVPLQRPTATRRREVPLDPALLAAFAGRYEAQGEGVFTVVRERAFLTIQPPEDWGLPKLRLRPESPHAFFASELPLTVTFRSDGGASVSEMLVHPPRGQAPIRAQRLDPKR